MTRFNITMNHALDLIERAVTTGKGGGGVLYQNYLHTALVI